MRDALNPSGCEHSSASVCPVVHRETIAVVDLMNLEDYVDLGDLDFTVARRRARLAG